jgi:hypothetical protein
MKATGHGLTPEQEAARAVVKQRKAFQKRVASLLATAEAYHDMHPYRMALGRMYIELSKEIEAIEEKAWLR